MSSKAVVGKSNQNNRNKLQNQQRLRRMGRKNKQQQTTWSRCINCGEIMKTWDHKCKD